MIFKSFILILTSKFILAQIDGEFWWLSDKLPFVKHIEAPKIEDNYEFDTDESAQIIFRDGDQENIKVSSITLGDKEKHKSEKWTINTHFKENDRIIYPNELTKPNFNKKNKTAVENELPKIDDMDIKGDEVENHDELKFYFPDNHLFSKNKNFDTVQHSSKDKMELTNKVDHHGVMAFENICSYMKKHACYRHKGVVYKKSNRIHSTLNLDNQLICCILPLAEEGSSKLIFPSSSHKRHKRSKQNDGTNIALKQRDVLMKRRYGTVDNKRDTTPKIVTLDEEDEDIDPYWNIKSSKIKTHSTSIKHDCYQDEDYVVELPKPGLLGVYSDHIRPGWPGQYSGNSYDDDYDDGTGYSTIDPRRDTTTSKFIKRGKPSKLSTITEESYDPESQTISYQSNPDFQVLQGFKLINLSRNKNKFYTSSKRITTESVIEENSGESVFTDSSSENRKTDVVSNSKQIYRNCGINTGSFVPIEGKQLGSSENGSHPWLGLVVLSKRRQTILCYATIVHPRAALTAADCVYGKSSGEVTLLAGLRDLKDRSNAQYRIPISLIHPLYKRNELANDLAILHWTVPLKLTTNVQPACLEEPQGNSDCFIYGWGGYDQAFRSVSRWQRASILTPRQCQARLASQQPKLPSEAFCAEVQARGTVTGVGGPLMCVSGGRQSAAGVAVWRRGVLVLLPASGWPQRALDTLLGAA